MITAAVVLGPGSIVASSRAGAEAGYRLLWVLAAACVLMAVYTAMGARLGCALEETPLGYVARRWGRPLAFLAGCSAFLVTAGFQFGNNIGVAVALSEITETPLWPWPLIFTALSLFFLIRARHVYQLLEKLMMLLVAVMLLSFVANLFWTGFHPVELARGLMSRKFTGSESIIARALLGTTFSVVAAFYQAYLVQAKGWRREHLPNAVGDAWIGIAILGAIALVILIGAAEALHGGGGDFASVGQLARQLRGLLGPWALFVFSLGLAAASFSSFIANALIGGAMMADGLGQCADTSGRNVRVWTAVIMLIGCSVAVGTILLQRGSTTSLLIAQAATLVATPLCAILLYSITSSRSIMGNLRNRWPSLMFGAGGLVLLGWLNLDLLLRLIRG